MHVLLNPALAHPNEVAGDPTGGLLADRKAGLRKDVVGVRVAKRRTEVDAISRRRCWGFELRNAVMSIGGTSCLWWRSRYDSF
jgi:hypothetical protein